MNPTQNDLFICANKMHDKKEQQLTTVQLQSQIWQNAMMTVGSLPESEARAYCQDLNKVITADQQNLLLTEINRLWL